MTRFQGNYGTYDTRMEIGGPGSCDCPVEGHCKHIEALEMTYDNSPETFVDLDPILAS